MRAEAAAPAARLLMQPHIEAPKAQARSSGCEDSLNPMLLVIIVSCLQFIQITIEQKFALAGDVVYWSVVEFLDLGDQFFLPCHCKKALSFVVECDVAEYSH